MIQESVFKHAIANSKGTKMPVIGSDDLLGYKVAFDEDTICKFNDSFSFKEVIANNINENQKLTELRDWLLPMLMNGQVKVN
jgi:type I restriction enzyme S subunit